MKLEDMEKLCEEVQGQFWTEEFEHTGKWIMSHNPPYGGGDVCQITVGGTHADAKFIAASRTLMPKLLAVAKAYISIVQDGRDHEPFCCCRLDSFKKVDDALEELEKE